MQPYEQLLEKLSNAGTSEGASKGWETKHGSGSNPATWHEASATISGRKSKEAAAVGDHVAAQDYALEASHHANLADAAAHHENTVRSSHSAIRAHRAADEAHSNFLATKDHAPGLQRIHGELRKHHAAQIDALEKKIAKVD